MAEIPVEKKGGIPWWVWLLLALLVAALLWWLLDDRDEVEQVTAAPYEEVAPADVGTVAGVPPASAPPASDAGAGPITDLATIFGTSDMSTLVGRQVELSSVRVQEVVGDRTFWVGPNANQRVFVVLNEQPTPGQPGTEGRYDVTAGQVINVAGLMREPGASAFGTQPIEALPAGQKAVIHAQSLDIVQRP